MPLLVENCRLRVTDDDIAEDMGAARVQTRSSAHFLTATSRGIHKKTFSKCIQAGIGCHTGESAQVARNGQGQDVTGSSVSMLSSKW